jgi:hypothetical protein
MKRLLNAFVGAIAVLTLGPGAAKTASAQIQDFPAVAVVDFVVESKATGVGMPDLGARAAAAIRTELAALGTADLIPIETINRVIGEMGWQEAPMDRASLIRLGQNLNVSTIVTGRVIDAQLGNSGNGRVARILVAVDMRDVASGLTINGGHAVGESGVRTDDVASTSLMGNAITDMAFRVVREMQARQLPSATVLNTLKDQALVNRGSRAGFRSGMEVIIIRGKDQVGSATVGSVDADSAFINYGNLIKGVQPGDKVRTLYSPERTPIGLSTGGDLQTSRRARGGSNSGLVSLLLVVLALAFLLGQGRGGNSDLASIKAEAMVTAADQAAVNVSWTRDPFLRGNEEGPFKWQVWRNDGSLAPVAVAAGQLGNIVDDAVGTNAPNGSNPWYNLSTAATTECNADIEGSAQTDAGNLLVPGTPYQYSVEVVFRISGLSLPGQATGGGGGTTTGGGGTTTGGTTTGGTTTGGTTGGTTTGGGTGEEWCYFISKRLNAKGIATPLVRPELRSPDPDQIVMTPIPFQFSSVRGPVLSVQLEYVIQLSTSPAFPSGTSQTITLTPFIELTEAGGQTVSSPTIDTTSFFPGAIDVYWRVGVRNPHDSPGPVRDSNGQRFIYSAVRRFKRSGIPPGPRPGGL